MHAELTAPEYELYIFMCVYPDGRMSVFVNLLAIAYLGACLFGSPAHLQAFFSLACAGAAAALA